MQLNGKKNPDYIYTSFSIIDLLNYIDWTSPPYSVELYSGILQVDDNYL